MAELLLELYSEEIPPQLQISARSQIKQFIENTFEEENIKYKEVFFQSEKEFSAYNFEFADTDTLLKSFENTEKECKSLLEKKLSMPAYDQCLKASHIFNLLDARGIVGVAERTGYITRIRELAKGCGALWLSSQS